MDLGYDSWSQKNSPWDTVGEIAGFYDFVFTWCWLVMDGWADSQTAPPMPKSRSSIT